MGQVFAVFIVVVGLAEVAACIKHIQNGYLPKWAPRRVITDPKWRQKQLSCDLVKKRVEDLEENNEVSTSFQQQQQQKQLESSQNNSFYEDGVFPRQQEGLEKRINESFPDNFELDDVRPPDAKIILGDGSIENETNTQSINEQLIQNEDNIQCINFVADLQNQMVCSEIKDILKNSMVPVDCIEQRSPPVTEIQQVIEIVNYSSQGPVECPSLNNFVPVIAEGNSITVSKVQECQSSPELQVQNNQDSVITSNLDQYIAIIDSISEQPNLISESKVQEYQATEQLNQKDKRPVQCSDTNQTVPINESITEKKYSVSGIRVQEYEPSIEIKSKSIPELVVACATVSTIPSIDSVEVPALISENVQEYEPSIKSQNTIVVVEYSAPAVEPIEQLDIIPKEVQKAAVEIQTPTELVEYFNTAPAVESVRQPEISEKIQDPLVKSLTSSELVECSSVTAALVVEQPEISEKVQEASIKIQTSPEPVTATPVVEQPEISEKVQEPSIKSLSSSELLECTTEPVIEAVPEHNLILEKFQECKPSIKNVPELHTTPELVVECSNVTTAPAIECDDQPGLNSEKIQEFEPSIKKNPELQNTPELVVECSTVTTAPAIECADSGQLELPAQVSDVSQDQSSAELRNEPEITVAVKLEPVSTFPEHEIVPSESSVTNGHATANISGDNEDLTRESDHLKQQTADVIIEDTQSNVCEPALPVNEIAINGTKKSLIETTEHVEENIHVSSEGTETTKKEIIEPEIESTKLVNTEVFTEKNPEIVLDNKTADIEQKVTKDTTIPKNDIRRTSEIFYAGDADLHYLQQLSDGSLEPKPSVDEFNKPEFPEIQSAHSEKVKSCDASIDEDIQNANKSELIVDNLLHAETCRVENTAADVRPPVDVNGNTEARLEPEVTAGDESELMTATPSSDVAEAAEQQVVAAAPPRESLVSLPHDGSTPSRKEKIINLLSGILTNTPVQNDEVQPSKKVDYENAKEVSETVEHITETTQEITETKTEYTGENVRKITRSPNIFTKSQGNVELKSKKPSEDINTAIIKPIIPRSQSQDNFEIQENKIEISEPHFEPQVSIPFESCDSPSIIPDEFRLKVESRSPPPAPVTPPPSPVNEENTLDTDQATTPGPSTSKSPSKKDSEANESNPQRVTIPREMKNTLWLIFSGEYTKAMSKDWHSGHFCCWQCDESLTGQRYVLRDDHPYCIKCYESVFANSCEECNKTIGIDSKDLSYKDKHWHEVCFLCTKCRVSLVDKQFGSKADKIYCGNCYDSQFASRCDGCGEIFRAEKQKVKVVKPQAAAAAACAV